MSSTVATLACALVSRLLCLLCYLWRRARLSQSRLSDQLSPTTLQQYVKVKMGKDSFNFCDHKQQIMWNRTFRQEFTSLLTDRDLTKRAETRAQSSWFELATVHLVGMKTSPTSDMLLVRQKSTKFMPTYTAEPQIFTNILGAHRTWWFSENDVVSHLLRVIKIIMPSYHAVLLPSGQPSCCQRWHLFH